MLEENVLASQPRFHFIADKQNDVSSIVVELDYPVDISEVSRVMENLLLESADKLLRYKGMLWIDGEPNRLLFQGVQRLYSADWDRPWGDETPHSTLVFIDPVAGRRDQSGICGVKEVTIKRLSGPAGICRPDKAQPPSGIFGLFLILLAQHRLAQNGIEPRLVAFFPAVSATPSHRRQYAPRPEFLTGEKNHHALLQTTAHPPKRECRCNQSHHLIFRQRLQFSLMLSTQRGCVAAFMFNHAHNDSSLFCLPCGR